MKTIKGFPGAECVFQLIKLMNSLAAGIYEGPIPGIIISNGDGRHPFIIGSAKDIEVVDSFTDVVPTVRIRGGPEGEIVVDPAIPQIVKVGKDNAGKAVFLTNIDE